MRRHKFERRFEIGQRLGQRLPRQGEHQVEIEGVEMSGGQFGRAASLVAVVDAPERLEVLRVEALDAERDARHAGFAKPCEPGRFHRAGVGFEGDFRVREQRHQRAHGGQDAVDSLRRKQAGGAAAEEHRVDRAPPDIGQRAFQVEQQCVDVGGFGNALRGVRIEVAVRTFLHAPRQMNVERQRRLDPQAAAGKPDDGFSQAASACRPVRARPGRGAKRRSSRPRQAPRRFFQTVAAGNTGRSRSRSRRAGCR